ncbi:hypothetical protein AAVH_30066, partial [Aphelenchoides avenae]
SIEASVNQLPPTVTEVAALHKDIDLVRTQLQTKLSLRDRVKKELANLGTVLEENVEEPPAGEASAKKKRKGRKKGHQKEPRQRRSERDARRVTRRNLKQGVCLDMNNWRNCITPLCV